MGQTVQTGNLDSQAIVADDVFARLRQRIDALCREDGSYADPETLANKLAERARVLRGRAVAGRPGGPQISFMAFRHANQRFGIPVADIVEVQPLTEYTPVPRAPKFLPGVIHWRGSILALLDLPRLFGVPDAGLVDERAYIVVEAAGHRIGVLAGEVEELCSAPLEQVRPAPDLPNDVPAEWSIGVCDRNRLILRTEMIVQDERLVTWRGTSSSNFE